ncbi:unnamed protein product [Prorocentrum cordatum]|uniref:Ion transport domain-containing protein n=1 Tax=Prorocentrum cordatum TaxID=2364126 RepID=A0ABN9SQQ7_9DINO|nr:unnamed protein product [Polarella glacialis]
MSFGMMNYLLNSAHCAPNSVCSTSCDRSCARWASRFTFFKIHSVNFGALARVVILFLLLVILIVPICFLAVRVVLAGCGPPSTDRRLLHTWPLLRVALLRLVLVLVLRMSPKMMCMLAPSVPEWPLLSVMSLFDFLVVVFAIQCDIVFQNSAGRYQVLHVFDVQSFYHSITATRRLLI